MMLLQFSDMTPGRIFISVLDDRAIVCKYRRHWGMKVHGYNFPDVTWERAVNWEEIEWYASEAMKRYAGGLHQPGHYPCPKSIQARARFE